MHTSNSSNSTVKYQATMLPNVDYAKIEPANNVKFSLVDLESGTLESCTQFLTEIRYVLREENSMHTSESLIAHLCAYLGGMMALHTVLESEKLESAVIELIQQQAKVSQQYFIQYPIPINDNVFSIKHKEENLDKLHQTTPSGIMTQTMCLNSLIMEILKELKSFKPSSNKTDTVKEQALLCSQDTLTKIVLYLSGKRCPQWRKQLDGLSDNYVINQLAIQIGWIIGYFAHLSNQPLEKTTDFSYATSTIQLYRAHIFQLMSQYAETQFAQEAEEASKANELVDEIHQISAKTHAQQFAPLNDFQKQVRIAHAGFEKIIIGLVTQGCSIKIIIASVFYFWVTLAEPLYRKIPAGETADPLKYMEPITHLVKKTLKPLPQPKLTPEINTLNEKMQALKQYIANQENIDHLPQAQIVQQTTQVNTAIHSAIGGYLNQNTHPEAVANALFCLWLRLSVFFGVTEQEWQKMDYYVVDILKAVKDYFLTNNNKF